MQFILAAAHQYRDPGDKSRRAWPLRHRDYSFGPDSLIARRPGVLCSLRFAIPAAVGPAQCGRARLRRFLALAARPADASRGYAAASHELWASTADGGRALALS